MLNTHSFIFMGKSMSSFDISHTVILSFYKSLSVGNFKLILILGYKLIELYRLFQAYSKDYVFKQMKKDNCL